jgi:hypothetical protein
VLAIVVGFATVAAASGAAVLWWRMPPEATPRVTEAERPTPPPKTSEPAAKRRAQPSTPASAPEAEPSTPPPPGSSEPAVEAKVQPATPAPPSSETSEPGKVMRDCPECPEMVLVPAGEFTMGSPPDEPDRSDDEGPQRQVTIAQPFWVGRYEVTSPSGVPASQRAGVVPGRTTPLGAVTIARSSTSAGTMLRCTLAG